MMNLTLTIMFCAMLLIYSIFEIRETSIITIQSIDRHIQSQFDNLSQKIGIDNFEHMLQKIIFLGNQTNFQNINQKMIEVEQKVILLTQQLIDAEKKIERKVELLTGELRIKDFEKLLSVVESEINLLNNTTKVYDLERISQEIKAKLTQSHFDQRINDMMYELGKMNGVIKSCSAYC